MKNSRQDIKRSHVLLLISGLVLVAVAFLVPNIVLFTFSSSSSGRGLSLFGTNFSLPSFSFTVPEAILTVALAAFARDTYDFLSSRLHHD